MSDNTEPARYREIEQRAEAATPGEWLEVYGDDETCSSMGGIISQAEYERVVAGRSRHRGHFPIDTAWIVVDPGVAPCHVSALQEDWDFITNARQDIPYLLAEARKLRAFLPTEEQREWLADWTGFYNEPEGTDFWPFVIATLEADNKRHATVHDLFMDENEKRAAAEIERDKLRALLARWEECGPGLDRAGQYACCGALEHEPDCPYMAAVRELRGEKVAHS